MVLVCNSDRNFNADGYRDIAGIILNSNCHCLYTQQFNFSFSINNSICVVINGRFLWWYTVVRLIYCIKV